MFEPHASEIWTKSFGPKLNKTVSFVKKTKQNIIKQSNKNKTKTKNKKTKQNKTKQKNKNTKKTGF